MSYDAPYDDEEWYEEDAEPGAEDAVRCPECDEPIHGFLDKCPACGYWLSAADRQALRPGESKPTWVRITTILVLAALLIGLLAAGVFF
jgi:hypothetical protein